jgi:hypothetical protein
MFKSIPKSNVSKRKFQVYKLWNTNQSEYPVNILSGSDPAYRSIKSKYYSNEGNVITLFGSTENIANIQRERVISDTIYVIDIDRNKFGEQIKRNSVNLIDIATQKRYVDDGWGKIVAPNPTYMLESLDVENKKLVISQDSTNYEITITSLNLETGFCILTLNGDTDQHYIINIDFQNNLVTFKNQLDFNGTDLKSVSYGNVFYSDGTLVLTAITLDNYTLEYRSTQTIYETEVLITARAGEFNYSQNPSAIDITLSGSYDFQTTAVNNSFPAGTKTIKEILDISRKEEFYGTLGSSTGSWDDYYNFGSVDPTGSYISTYITTIGLYDDNNDMVAIAKLPQPIKNLPDYDINFIIRFDT